MACFEPRVLIQMKKEAPYPDHQKKSAKKFINVYASGKSYEYWQKKIDWINEHEEDYRASWCGCWNCEGCRQSRMKSNAVRCVAESTEWEENYFITVTYNPENLVILDEIESPITGCTYCDDGTWGGTLVKEHFKKFQRDLRRYWKYHYNHDNIRFYMCGEYGGQYGRPHGHYIFFNLPIPAELLKPYRYTPEGWLYKCEVIEKIWGRGFITVAECNLATCQYVAGYVLKKLRNDWGKEYYYQEGRIPEFTNCSRRPGIGRDYYEKHKEEIYECDEITIQGMTVGKAKPSSYYDNLFDIDDHEKMQEIKEQRQEAAKRAMELEDAASTLTRAERYELKRSIWNDRTKTLRKRQNIDNDNRKVKTR